MGLKTWILKKVAKQLGKNLKEGPVDKKEFWKSKTFWSNVVVVLIGTYELVKANMAPNLPTIPPILLTVLGALGIYGRAKADKPLGL